MAHACAGLKVLNNQLTATTTAVATIVYVTQCLDDHHNTLKTSKYGLIYSAASTSPTHLQAIPAQILQATVRAGLTAASGLCNNGQGYDNSCCDMTKAVLVSMLDAETADCCCPHFNKPDRQESMATISTTTPCAHGYMTTWQLQ
jgi:hypothetical protein